MHSTLKNRPPRKKPPFSQHDSPWAPGDEPYGLSLNPYEATVEELGIIKVRSFRSDLLHKLHVIMRAHGGWNWQTTKFVSYKLKISVKAIDRWSTFKAHPTASKLEAIDRLYEESIGTLKQGRIVPDTYREKKAELDAILGLGLVEGHAALRRRRREMKEKKPKAAKRSKADGPPIDPAILNAPWSPEELLTALA